MRLAVFTSQLGTRSESFIRRHATDLLPGETVVVARHSHGGAFWTVSAPTLYADEWSARISVRLAGRLGIPTARAFERTLVGFLRDHGVDVVLGEYFDQFVAFVPILERAGLPYVVQGHGIDLSAAMRRPGVGEQYLAYRSARALLTRCEHHRRRLIEIGLPPALIHVNPGGVDIPATAPARGPDAPKHFLAVGRLVAKKGPLQLLQAFQLAAASDPDITLDVVGVGPLLSAAREFVKAHRLDKAVVFHGAASDETKTILIRKCATFVQHSLVDPETHDEEGLPAAIQEAMANQMAVISTRHSGIPEAVTDGVHGVLVAEGDVSGMAAAMLRVASSACLAGTLGAEGRLRARHTYSWPAERARLLEHLQL